MKKIRRAINLPPEYFRKLGDIGLEARLKGWTQQQRQERIDALTREYLEGKDD